MKLICIQNHFLSSIIKWWKQPNFSHFSSNLSSSHQSPHISQHALSPCSRTPSMVTEARTTVSSNISAASRGDSWDRTHLNTETVSGNTPAGGGATTHWQVQPTFFYRFISFSHISFHHKLLLFWWRNIHF